MAVIEVNAPTKYYGKSRGIEEPDLEVYKDEIFGFLSPNLDLKRRYQKREKDIPA